MTAEHTNLLLVDYASETVQQYEQRVNRLNEEAEKNKGNFYIDVSFPLMKLY